MPHIANSDSTDRFIFLLTSLGVSNPHLFILGNYVNKHTVVIRCANYLLKKLRVTARLPSRHHRPLTLGKFYLRSFQHFSFSSSARNSIAMSTALQQDLPTSTQPEPVVSNVLISAC